MALRLIFNRLIPDDLTVALDYYEEISPALADRFRAEVNRRLDEIAERPESFPVDVSQIRFAKLHRFPYLVFFAVQSEFISVIAIVHGSSAPDEGRNRS